MQVAAGDSADSPIGAAEFAALLDPLGPFEPAPLLAVGVSGGADSLALVLLADRWARARRGSVLALTVDHALRDGSAAEAAQVGHWLAARGIAHEVLRWDGPKPATAIQETARAARYRLLGQRCAGTGILHLLLAHHRDDQAETVLLRRAQGSGRDGLAGMAAIRETDQLCRLAGDEFVLILENLNEPSEAAAVAKKVLDAVVQPLTLQGQALRLSTSIGVACHVGGPESESALLGRADDALYAAKAAGRGCWRMAE